ncbi:hypothetical protein AB3N61_09375 [Leptospira sp. WS58.C1]|uniref:hypothetical protein n=1 Tax=Leptospira cinconiae TaxID=3235173 RepID=UPI00349E763B
MKSRYFLKDDQKFQISIWETDLQPAGKGTYTDVPYKDRKDDSTRKCAVISLTAEEFYDFLYKGEIPSLPEKPMVAGEPA